VLACTSISKGAAQEMRPFTRAHGHTSR